MSYFTAEGKEEVAVRTQVTVMENLGSGRQDEFLSEDSIEGGMSG